MTLNIGISRPQGVIQSSDHRLLWYDRPRNVTSANKHVVSWTCGGFMLIAYCGVGAFRLGGRTWKTDEWLEHLLTRPPVLRDIVPGQPRLEMQRVLGAIRTIETQATEQLGEKIQTPANGRPVAQHCRTVFREEIHRVRQQHEPRREPCRQTEWVFQGTLGLVA